MIRTILDNLAESLSEDSSAYEGRKIAKAEAAIIDGFLHLLESSDAAAVHQGLVSRLHEVTSKSLT